MLHLPRIRMEMAVAVAHGLAHSRGAAMPAAFFEAAAGDAEAGREMAAEAARKREYREAIAQHRGQR